MTKFYGTKESLFLKKKEKQAQPKIEDTLFLILMQRGYFGTEVFRSLNSLKLYDDRIYEFSVFKSYMCPK